MSGRRTDSAIREKKLRDLKFDVNRSIRYHAGRQAFYEAFDLRINVANLILGSWAVLTLLDTTLKFKTLVLVQGAVIAALSFINLSMRSAEKASKHSQFRQRYYDLMRRLHRIDVGAPDFMDQIAACNDARFEVEREEPPTNCVFDLVAHNEQVMAQGGREEDMWFIPRGKRWFANLIQWDTTEFGTLAAEKLRRQQKEANKKRGTWRP